MPLNKMVWHAHFEGQRLHQDREKSRLFSLVSMKYCGETNIFDMTVSKVSTFVYIPMMIKLIMKATEQVKLLHTNVTVCGYPISSTTAHAPGPDSDLQSLLLLYPPRYENNITS